MRKRKDGAGWIWLCSLSLAAILFMMAAVAWLIGTNSLSALWPEKLACVELKDGTRFLGIEMRAEDTAHAEPRRQYKVANRDLNNGMDFRWVSEREIANVTFPVGAVLVKRVEGGDFYGIFQGIERDAGETASVVEESLEKALRDSRSAWSRQGQPLEDKLGKLGMEWQNLRLDMIKNTYAAERSDDGATRKQYATELTAMQAREQRLKKDSDLLLADMNKVKGELAAVKAIFSTGDGKRVYLAMPSLIDAWQPNVLSTAGKMWRCLKNAWSFLVESPREANTDGGIFPALFGTVFLILLMSISAFPLGVAAGIYLREYSKGGLPSRLARVAVNNLAGVPSIVFGIFGLGFFVYGLGGSLDQVLYPERVEAGISTFGTGGIFWSSLTLGLLTLPVVIVATEEALAAVPGEMRQGSLALGATKFQTLRLVLLPMAAPGILTGFILAMARAAGEVAPLMLTGVVKSAPALALDSSWPFVHLDRKFMHLGFHIYDMGFQSPNVEASKPLVYLTALVLLILVFGLNAAAFRLRRKMRERYAMKGF